MSPVLTRERSLPVERAIKLARNVDVVKGHQNRPSVLCLNRASFSYDIDALRRYAPRLSWAFLNTSDLHNHICDWIPERYQFQEKYAEYDDADARHVWADALRFGRVLLSKLHTTINLRAVMAANWDYWTDEALRLACADLKIPFVTLLREMPILPFDAEVEGNFYQSYTLRPNIATACVGGKSMANVLEKCGVLPADKIQITGLPRFDRWHSLEDKSPSPRPTFVLFEFSDSTYLAPSAWKETVEIFVRKAHEYPQARFIVKLKPNTSNMKELREAVPQCEFMANEHLWDILPQARMVIGYNSMALIESLLSSARIVIPQWGDAQRPQREQALMPSDKTWAQGIEYARYPQHMESMIETAMDGMLPLSEEQSAARRQCFDEFFHFDPQRLASKAVEDVVMGLI